MKTMGKDRVVVITGASAGLGRATARAFARRGARLGLIARDRVRLDAACDEARELGGEAIALPLDVSDSDAVETAADRVEATFGPIDVWVNNAMVSVFAPVWTMTATEYRRVTEVTYLGVVHGTLAALRRMRPRDAGTIVQVGSALAYRGIPLQSAYCASKHAIQGFMDSLRCELLHEDSGIHVTSVHMPALNTPQFDWSRSHMERRPQPVPPIYSPEVGAEAVVFAASARRREVWVGRPTVLAILANRLAPALADRYLARTGIESQLTDEPERPGRCENLITSCPGTVGATGRFSDRAQRWSPQFWLSRHRGAVSVAVATALAVASGLGVAARWRGREAKG
jgi:NAD(P)-dependent dehydrogenase (short-subunit alcohol dehydrogenase family)